MCIFSWPWPNEKCKFVYMYVYNDNHLLKTVKGQMRPYKRISPIIVELSMWIVTNDGLFAVLNALGSVWVNNLIHSQTLLKISIMYHLFLPHVIFSALVNKDREKPFVGVVRHQEGVGTRQNEHQTRYSKGTVRSQ